MWLLLCLGVVTLKKRKRKEKTTPFGINLMRSPELYRAAQVLSLKYNANDKAPGQVITDTESVHSVLKTFTGVTYLVVMISVEGMLTVLQSLVQVLKLGVVLYSRSYVFYTKYFNCGEWSCCVEGGCDII